MKTPFNKKTFHSLISAAALSTVSSHVLAGDNQLLNLVSQQGGLHRVTYEQLKESGADLAGFSANDMAITFQGKAVTRFVKDAEQDGFGEGDYIEYVAEDVYNRYTTDAVYTLELDKSLVKPVVELAPMQVAKRNITDYATAKITLAEQNKFWITSPNLEDPYYMANLLASTKPISKEFTIDLPQLASNTDNLVLTIGLLGGSDTAQAIDHSVEILFNGEKVASKQFSGKSIQNLEALIPAHLAKETGNVLEVVLPLDIDVAYDLVAIDHIEVAYPRTLAADSSALAVTSNAAFLQFTKLTAGDAVYEQYNDALVRTESVSQELIVRSIAPLKELPFYVATGDVPSPEIQSLVSLENITEGEAQYLIIAHEDFIDESLQQLVDLRQGRFSTKVVNVEQVYTQFGNGVAEAQPIYEYIKFAKKNLNTEMVLIVGGDTHDYHGYLGNSVSHVPTLYKKIGSMTTTVTHAPSDAAYGDVDSDGVPEIAIGRLPVRTKQELADVVAKILMFEQRDYQGKTVFAADKKDNAHNHDFTPEAEEIISALPKSLSTKVQKAFATVDGVKAAGSKVIDAINEGVELTAYLGHSSMYKWSAEGIVDNKDFETLTNFSKPTVVTQYGCWNTLFTLPNGNSMAHTALLSGQNGAVTVMGASTLTLAKSEVELGKALFETMYVPGKTLGQALIEAKKKISVNKSRSDVLLGWQIIGDPAIVMNQVH